VSDGVQGRKRPDAWRRASAKVRARIEDSQRIILECSKLFPYMWYLVSVATGFPELLRADTSLARSTPGHLHLPSLCQDVSAAP
jgi:hypothetical protein